MFLAEQLQQTDDVVEVLYTGLPVLLLTMPNSLKQMEGGFGGMLAIRVAVAPKAQLRLLHAHSCGNARRHSVASKV